MSYSKVNSMSETFTRIEPKYKCADISKEEKIAGRERLAASWDASELISDALPPLYMWNGQHYSLRKNIWKPAHE